VEFEQSLKSDHELRKEKDKRQAELLKKGEIEIDLDSEASKQTAHDFEDANTDELSKFQFASRTTEADKKNDTRSLERKLDDTLILLLEQKIGDKNFALLPQGKRQDGETMRQTAERVLKEKCGSDLKVFFYGNAPSGFYKYKYPADQRSDAVGAKIFFYRTAFKSGNITNQKAKYEWLSPEEARKKVKEPYFHSVSQFLIV
jgi:large subunit ribosomal protein L46